MKSFKQVSVFVATLLLFVVVSCNDEPLEGDFNTDPGGSDLTCAEATQNLTAASTNYGTTAPDEASFAVVCNAYAVALQDMINACGDSTGAIQTLLNGLDCPTVSDDCSLAQTATATAATAYTTDTTNATLCNVYIAALQNEIAQCGDADGSLQTIIDGLDCSSDEPTIVGVWKPIKVVNVCSSGFEEVYDNNECGQMTRLTFLVDGTYMTSEFSDDTGTCIEYLNATGTWELNGTNLIIVIEGETYNPIIFELIDNTFKFGYYDDTDFCENGEQLSHEYTECVRVN